MKAASDIPHGICNFFAYSIWLIIINLQDSSNKLPLYWGILIFGIKYSNDVPDHDTRPLYFPSVVSVLLNEFQCFAGTSFLAIAIKLACLASDANKS